MKLLSFYKTPYRKTAHLYIIFLWNCIYYALLILSEMVLAT